VEIIEDYNARYGHEFRMATYGTFKKDIAYRLAHKEQYKGIEKSPEQQLDLLIVVDHMLTGLIPRGLTLCIWTRYLCIRSYPGFLSSNRLLFQKPMVQFVIIVAPTDESKYR
jgi:hypothetical protein